MLAITETLYQRFHLELERFILQKVKDKTTTQDILQDVFVKIHLHLHTLKDQSKLNAWIYQLARNTINDYYRKQVNANENTDVIEDTHELQTQVEQGLENCVSPFIAQLPPKYQQALILADIDGMSQTQLATHLNISYSAAKSRVQRARQKLKTLFTDCCRIHTDKYGNVLSYEQKECNRCK
jgi:RNA polymerase sigma-70 factor, ECF subfamily